MGRINFRTGRLNRVKEMRPVGGDIWRAMRLQNLCLFIFIFVLMLGGSAIFAALVLKPVPVLLINQDGRLIGRIEYSKQPPFSEAQLESASKLFVQYYLSQNSATVYADAEVALTAMCPDLRRRTQKSWIEGGRLAAIIQRVQISRVIFSDFEILKYLNGEDIQVALQGKILISDTSNLDGNIQNSSKTFHMELAMRQVPVSELNYLGVEVCSVQFI